MKLSERVDSYQDDMTRALQGSSAFDSIMPDADNRRGYIEMGQGDEVVVILAHRDLASAIMGYFAIKALHETSAEDDAFLLKKRVRLFLDPDSGLMPDSDFPLIHAEMGLLTFELVKKLQKTGKGTGRGIILRSMKGGSAHNMVADHCQAVLSGEGYDAVKNKIQAFSARTGYQITAKGRGRALEITATGTDVNAISVMMAFLGELDLQGEEITDFISFYNSKIGFDLNGTGGIGCALEDEISGKLRFNVGLTDVNEEMAGLTVCLRYPVTSDGEHVYDSMREVIHAYDLGVVKIEDKKPVYSPLDTRCSHKSNELIETALLIQYTKIYAEAIFGLAGGRENDNRKGDQIKK